MVFNDDMASQSRCIGHNNMITQDTVVGHMAVSHEIIMIANYGATTTLNGATIHRNILPKNIVIANNQLGILSFMF